MAVHSTFLGSVKITGQEAAAFARKITQSRGTKAASEAARKGVPLATAFVKNGVVRIALKKERQSA